MAGTTAKLALPYPSPPDPADVPADIQALAAKVDALYNAVNGFAPLDANGKLPRTVLPDDLAYVEATAGLGITATTEAGAQAFLTAPAITFDGASRIHLEAFAPWVNPPTTAGSSLHVLLFDGGTALGIWASFRNTPASAAGTQQTTPLKAERFLTPTAAAHTYSVRLYGTVNASAGIGAGPGGAGQYLPAFLRIRRA